MQQPYTPSKKTLEKYAHVLVNFALNNCKGIKKGDVVHITCHEVAKPLFFELQKAVWQAGGHVIARYLPDDTHEHNFSRCYFDHAGKPQFDFFAHKYTKGLIDEIDHSIYIIAERNKEALKGVDPKKIMRNNASMKPFMDMRNKKENAGNFTWTLALYGTPEMAAEVNLTEKEYWGEIIKACYLNVADPVAKWKETYRELEKYRKRLNNITEQTEYFHMQGPDVDLKIVPGAKRRWMGGSGRNIPSFELFTSPDWRGTEGWIRFSEPLYRYGNIITGVELWFEKGKVVKSKATKNHKVLKEMIATKNADKVGEYSLTDGRFSKITKFMGETLFDENVGGRYGNTHIALGNSYHDCYDGDPSRVSKAQWAKLGYNDSVVHTDIVSTTDRIVVAHFKGGGSTIIYQDGKYQF